MSRYLDDPRHQRRRKGDSLPRPVVPAVMHTLPSVQKTEIKELPEGRYLIARRSTQEGDIMVLAKQPGGSSTWVKTAELD